MSMIGRIGRALKKMPGDALYSPRKLGGITAVAFAAGMAKGGTSNLVDYSFDAAFDNPQADRAFVGGDLGVTSALGASGIFGGKVGSAIGFASNFTDYSIARPDERINPNITIGTGAVLGGLGGGAYGFSKGKGILGRTAGAYLGAGLGGVTGGLAGTAVMAYQGKRIIENASNSGFINSPYYGGRSSVSLRLADMNASGGVVLGAHNSRRTF